MTIASDMFRAAGAPFTADGGVRIFALDTTPDSISDLAAGVHEVYNAGPDLAVLRLGAEPSLPSDKGAEVSGQYVIPAGGSITLACAATTALHGLVQSSTAQLYIMRRVAP